MDLRRDTSFHKNIVSSSERLHNQNICVVVIFVPILYILNRGDIMELLNVCIYLRKSRADREAEARGEGETQCHLDRTFCR